MRPIAVEALGDRYRRYRLADPAAEEAMAWSLRQYGQSSPVVACVRALERIAGNWREPHGDRRQELVFIGLDEAAVHADLDACLLTDAEMTAGEQTWALLPDPFPSWEE